MKQGFVFSFLFHSIVAAVFAWHFTSDARAAKNFYTVDLSITGGKMLGGSDQASLSNIVVPDESEDFLKTPSKSEKPKREEKPSGPSAPLKSVPGLGAGKGQAVIGMGGGMGNFPYPFYLETMRTKIAMNWDVKFWRDNLLARRSQVEFVIARDGSLDSSKITERSGDSHYDLTCLRSVNLAAPFQPFPQGFDQQKLRILFDFEIVP
ncbi:MAG: TonB C-terminal domain-containing protein [Elusimicrobia bacterium]|nr:TonB C-terminal domain-containing protein [Elusimicrobiota bacterium]